MYYDSLSFEKFPAAYCASMASFFVYTHNINGNQIKFAIMVIWNYWVMV